MSNSKLIKGTYLSPNHSGKRTMKIDRITPHCVVGQLSAKSVCDIFKNPTRQASSNYVIGTAGEIALCVDEGNRSWCSASNSNDQRAVTIECASDLKTPYAMNDKVYKALISLCVDICKRNGKKKLLWLGNKDKTLNYKPESDEMIITVHKWFSNTACPGEWLYSRLDDLGKKVTNELNPPAKKKTTYYVMTGAYGVKSNAENQLKKVKAKSIDAKIVYVDKLYKVQAGSFSKKVNADAFVKKLKDKGFSAYISLTTGKTVNVSTKKSIEAVAKEVIEGKWGNGEQRKKKLTEAGYDYNAVQKKVNDLL